MKFKKTKCDGVFSKTSNGITRHYFEADDMFCYLDMKDGVNVDGTFKVGSEPALKLCELIK